VLGFLERRHQAAECAPPAAAVAASSLRAAASCAAHRPELRRERRLGDGEMALDMIG